MLALTLGIAVLTIKILLMDIERSRLEMRNQRLIQRVAMLEADFEASDLMTTRLSEQPLKLRAGAPLARLLAPLL